MATSTSTFPGGDDDEAGYFGVAITRNQRIRKNMDKLYRLHHKLAGVQDEIDDTENKLEMLGIDVEDLYDGWNEADEDDYEDMAFDDRGGAVGYDEDDEDDGYDDEYDDDYPEEDEPEDEDPREYGKLAKSILSGGPFVKPSIVPQSPWIAAAAFTAAGRSGAQATDAPASQRAPQARRMLADAAKKKGQGVPIWVYEQRCGDRNGADFLVYFVAAAEPISPEVVKAYGPKGIGAIRLVARANGAEKVPVPAVPKGKGNAKNGSARPGGGMPPAGAFAAQTPRGAARGGNRRSV